jgi:hypothetical protein
MITRIVRTKYCGPNNNRGRAILVVDMGNKPGRRRQYIPYNDEYNLEANHIRAARRFLKTQELEPFECQGNKYLFAQVGEDNG